MANENKVVEAKYIIKSGEYFLAKPGLTRDKKYARQFSRQQAMEKKQYLADDHITVELIEVEQQ
jgi:hypothetical protein